jgi:iron complex outermembrane receptor protein
MWSELVVHGVWLLGDLRPIRRIAVPLAIASLSSPALASDVHSFDVASARLSEALSAFGNQAGISIGISDPRLSNVRVRAVHGRMSVERALAHMLQDTGLAYRAIDPQTYRIVAATLPQKKIVKTIRPVPPDVAPDIVVTASKRAIGLRNFPATVSIFRPDDLGLGGTAGKGTDAIVETLPSVNSTHLGPGRNKLFIRGVADSSFTGPTQATVGQYLGDVRLNYNAPDPDLTLYDVDRVEVLEGPHGALYGAASLGGIVRIIPNPPQPDRLSARFEAGVVTTRHGASGGDLAGMLNIPILNDRIAMRAVAYRSIDAGYIDDVRRGLDNVNRSRTIGGRLGLRILPGDGWTIDTGGLVQNINSADSQYADKDLPPLTRASALAQPFDNDYLLGQIVIKKHWDGLELTSATGIVRHDVSAMFDATPLSPTGAVSEFSQHNHITLISNETRLSRQFGDGSGWLAGATLVSNSERLTRLLGPPNALVRITGVRNDVVEAAIFGEATLHVAPSLSISGGGRLAYTRQVGAALDSETTNEEPKRTGAEFLPSLALTWRPGSRLTGYVRYEEGFRAGGLSVAESGSGLSVKHFKGDAIGTYEIGFRYNDKMVDRLSVATSVSYGHWEHIQADLIDANGLPFTANIGTGNVFGLELSTTWRPIPGLMAELALLLNESSLVRPTPGFDAKKNADLPNVSDTEGRVAISYNSRIGGGFDLSIGASARYAGLSHLGVGPSLHIRQGRYTDTMVRTRLARGNLEASVELHNVLDTVGNRFSLGDPFGVMGGQQTTPLRPRTLRIGIGVAF